MKTNGRKGKAGKGLCPVENARPRELIRQVLRRRLQEAMRGLMYDLLEQEVQALCGPRYQRGRQAEGVRAGSETGSVYWDGGRQPIRRPRVRNEGGEVTLETYQALRDYDLFSDEVQRLLIHGVSTRDYGGVVQKLEEDLPLSKSSASRAFVRASQRDLDELNGRDLSGQTYACLMIDGIEEAQTHVIVALGFTTGGSKRILGLVEGATENSTVVKDLLASLIERGLTTTERVLLVLDGAKALHKAVGAQWGDRAMIQRCQEHKIRNVRRYLPASLQDETERRMRAAYGLKSYPQARAALQKVLAWLEDRCESAARSLAEGLAETLTVQRLGLPEVLGRTFRSTNPIESMFDKIAYRCRRVKSWRGKQQVVRWAASSLLVHEPRFRRVRGYRQMHVLLAALENVALDAKTKVA